jgi:hypothetical protein
MLRLEPELAFTVTVVGAAAPLVVTVNVCMVLCAGTVRLSVHPPVTENTARPGQGLKLKETTTPPTGATSLIVTVPVDCPPPVTDAGLKFTWTTGGGRTVSITVAEPVPPAVAVAVTVTGVALPTVPAMTINV